MISIYNSNIMTTFIAILDGRLNVTLPFLRMHAAFLGGVLSVIRHASSSILVINTTNDSNCQCDTPIYFELVIDSCTVWKMRFRVVSISVRLPLSLYHVRKE